MLVNKYIICFDKISNYNLKHSWIEESSRWVKFVAEALLLKKVQFIYISIQTSSLYLVSLFFLGVNITNPFVQSSKKLIHGIKGPLNITFKFMPNSTYAHNYRVFHGIWQARLSQTCLWWFALSLQPILPQLPEM